MNEQDWIKMFSKINDGTTKEKWQELYYQRHKIFKHTHIYYILKK